MDMALVAKATGKHLHLVRAMKVMGTGLPGGNSFMEDYTYHFEPDNSLVLGSHMLEICPSIANAKPSCEIHPLGIGGKADPVRLVFNVNAGPALNASIVDMGNRFRLLVNEVEAVKANNRPYPNYLLPGYYGNHMPDMETGCAVPGYWPVVPTIPVIVRTSAAKACRTLPKWPELNLC